MLLSYKSNLDTFHPNITFGSPNKDIPSLHLPGAVAIGLLFAHTLLFTDSTEPA
jgi:hypothetical protein